MSRAFLRGTELWRAALRVVARSGPHEASRIPATRGVTRDLAMQASELHPQAPFQFLRRNRVKYGGLAVAAAGSIGLTLLYLQIQEAEELLPAVVEEAASPERIGDFYNLGGTDMLGRGQFGTVFLATDKATGELVAIKRIPRAFVKESSFREETEAHRDVSNHPNIVGLKGVFSDDDAFYMVMELAAGGELYDRLTMEGVFLEDYEVRDVLRETADALAYMHGVGIVHGDVKPENILLSTPAAGANGGVQKEIEKEVGRLGKALLADFGSSFRLPKSSGGHGRRMVKAYTAAYSAPEVVLNGCLVDEKADVWSLGVIAYVMYKGYHPFDPTSDSTDEEIVEAVITSDPDWDGLEPRVAHLIQKMLSKNPSDRPSAREILQNPWLQVANKS